MEICHLRFTEEHANTQMVVKTKSVQDDWEAIRGPKGVGVPLCSTLTSHCAVIVCSHRDMPGLAMCLRGGRN